MSLTATGASNDEADILPWTRRLGELWTEACGTTSRTASKIVCCPSIARALVHIEGIDGDADDGHALVTGSLYLVGDVLRRLNEPSASTIAEKAVE